jgi:hypothetical protein
MMNFPSPKSVEEALQRKRQIADDVTQFQVKLKERHPNDENGRVISDHNQRAAYRERLKTMLARRYEELRFLKDWLRLNATRKPSEWEMLGRAYRLLTMMEDRGVPIGEEGDVLLSDLEMHVPHIHLVGDTQKAGAA